MRQEQSLKILLRIMGSASALAALAVLMPREWMATTHQQLGLGPFPEGAIVEYLARSISILYALCGGLLWVVSFDPRRFGPVITFCAIGYMLFALIMLGIDLRLGMLWWWALMEGPWLFVLGAVMLVLQWQCHRAASPSQETTPEEMSNLEVPNV